MFLTQHAFSLWLKLYIVVASFFVPSYSIADSGAKAPTKHSLTGSKISLSVKATDSDIHYLINSQNLADTVNLPHLWNSLHFSFRSSGVKGLEYSYKLKGLDEKWSDWSADTSIDYTNLSHGSYDLGLRIRNQSGELLRQIDYPLSISTPWYKNVWAYLIYMLSCCILIYLFIQKQLKYAELENKHKIYPDLIDFYHSESDKITSLLHKEELIAEVNSKNKELATVTMHLVERGKLLSKIREELVMVLKNNQPLAASNEFKIVLRMLSDAEKNRHDWEQFSIHFDEVHRNFLSALKSQYPALSTTDLKLCAYLRLNLSSKEIAQSMNITVKGVEVSRYRLRKKLNISKDVNLFDYLLQITNLGTPKQIAPSSNNAQPQEDDLAKFLSFFNKSMTAKFISQGGYDLSGEGIIFKRPVTHNK